MTWTIFYFSDDGVLIEEEHSPDISSQEEALKASAKFKRDEMTIEPDGPNISVVRMKKPKPYTFWTLKQNASGGRQGNQRARATHLAGKKSGTT